MRRAASLQTIVVGPEVGLAEGGADDPVVRARRVEAVLDEEVLLDAVDLDLQRARAVAGRHRRGQRAAVADPELLERAQRGAGGAADVVRAGLQPVELLDDRERHDHVDVFELERRTTGRR